MINVLFFILFLVTCDATHIVNDIQTKPTEDLELETQLKLITKPSIKSIHTKFGYNVDCINITEQPAFEHPLLKNHKLQRKPSFIKSTGKRSVDNSSTKPIIGLEKGTCPVGTVPIRRTTKDDLIRAKSLLLNDDNPPIGTHVAEVALKYSEGPVYGVSGKNSIYHPTAGNNQSTTSHLIVRNGPYEQPISSINMIIVGWQVDPQLYGGDDATHLFSLWTSDGFKSTGCFDMQCPGFVQIADNIYPGLRLTNTSVYGESIVEIEIALSQNPTTKDWWLFIDNKPIGYFPAALFSDLSSTTSRRAVWGGRVSTSVDGPSPQMGSGYFPDDNFSHSCYFKNIAFQNVSLQNIEPNNDQVVTFTDNPTCYAVKFYPKGTQYGPSLQFGGPGGNCD